MHIAYGRTRPTCFTIACHTAERRRHLIDTAAAEKKSIGTPPPPPPVKITRHATAERMTSAQGSVFN